MPCVTSGACHPFHGLNGQKNLPRGLRALKWLGLGEGTFHIRNVLKVSYFKLFNARGLFKHICSSLSWNKKWSFQTFSFVIYFSPLLPSRWSGTRHRLIIWVVCGRWGGETGSTIISGLLTSTHNSNCTLVTDAIVPHWPFQTHGTLLALPDSQEIWPRSKDKESSAVAATECAFFLMNSRETASSAPPAPFPSFL